VYCLSSLLKQPLKFSKIYHFSHPETLGNSLILSRTHIRPNQPLFKYFSATGRQCLLSYIYQSLCDDSHEPITCVVIVWRFGYFQKACKAIKWGPNWKFYQGIVFEHASSDIILQGKIMTFGPDRMYLYLNRCFLSPAKGKAETEATSLSNQKGTKHIRDFTW